MKILNHYRNPDNNYLRITVKKDFLLLDNCLSFRTKSLEAHVFLEYVRQKSKKVK